HGYRQERVNKSKTETIDIAKALTIGAGYQVSVGASKNETVGITFTEEVGVLKHTIVGEKYEIMVGKTSITMYANGDIFIEGDDIDIIGTDHIEIIAPKIYIDGGKAETVWNIRLTNLHTHVISKIVDKDIVLKADTTLADGTAVQATLLALDRMGDVLVKETHSTSVSDSQIEQTYDTDQMLKSHNLEQSDVNKFVGEVEWQE
ncbi:MAG: hypothetical protein PHQ90_08955, partial [Sulfuricurvum sp.]|uniref:hypothetical protein n=1 Tax=Sulfuricurvum sp. TaxID=2025608 RepID=UPI00262E42FE